MDTNEIQREIDEQLENAIDAIVYKKKQALTAPENIESLTNAVTDSVHFRQTVRELQEKHLATSIGNRLRCGCWDAMQMDRAFEAAWSDELQKALVDRVRSKVDKVVDAMILDKLKKLTTLLENSR